jgi:DNA-binding NarL/FixJ family response regulator
VSPTKGKGKDKNRERKAMAKAKRREPEPVDEGEVDEVNEVTAQPQVQQQQPETLADFLAETFGHSDIGPEPEPTPPEGTLPSILWIRKNFKTKSAAIRYLISKGHQVKDIANLLNVKYQHVRNVKVTHLKRGPNESWLPASERKADPPTKE